MRRRDSRPKIPAQRHGKGPGARVREWVGGRLTLPVYITAGAPYRPEMVLWLELPEDLIVGHEVIDPKGPPVSFAETLRRAMASPMAGPPRRPRRIRVAEAHLAAELRGAIPDMEVVVAATPELDAVMAAMMGSLPGDGSGQESYFEGGRIAADAVAVLFEAADALFRLAPWRLAQDSQVLRLDIPALGVEGACVSIIGALGESLGLVIFPSHLAMERFQTLMAARHEDDGPLDMGTATLSLNYGRGADLPAGMRREAAEHGWPVAGPAAYPWVQHRDRDGTMRPLEERDMRIAAACASAVAGFFSKHRACFEQAAPQPDRERLIGPGGIETWLAMPYEAGGPRVSGEECAPPHLPPASQVARPSAAELHQIDNRLIEGLMDFAARRFDKALQGAARALTAGDGVFGLLPAFLVYQVLIDGQPVAQWFAQENDGRLSDTERAWMEAQQASRLSVWEALSVDPGRGLRLRDLLTGEVREVQEVGASKSLIARYAMLARVVDFRGLSLLCGVHLRPLPPRETAQVVERARSLLRRKGTDAGGRLRGERMGRYLISRWEEAVAELDGRTAALPRLENTDGEDLLLTTDRFDFDPSLRSQILSSLAAMDGIRPEDDGGPELTYLLERPGGGMVGGRGETVLAMIRIDAGRLRVETNSVARADRIRERIEAACGGQIRHRSREHTDPLALMGQRGGIAGPGDRPSPLPSDEANAAIQAMKGRHYAHWPDQPLPALGGKTPRAAVRTQTGREQVEVLLKEFEISEVGAPEGQRFDFSILRQDLGLPS